MTIEKKQIGSSVIWSVKPDKHWCSVALAIAAGAIGYSGHDGWGWCLFLIWLIEVL